MSARGWCPSSRLRRGPELWGLGALQPRRQGLLQSLKLPLGLQKMALASDPLQLVVQAFPSDAALGAAQGVVPQQLLLHHLLPGSEHPGRSGCGGIALVLGRLARQPLQERGGEEVRLNSKLLGPSLLHGCQVLLLLQDPLMDCGKIRHQS